MSHLGSMLSMLHQCVHPLLELSVFAMINRYFPFFRNHQLMIDRFIHMILRKSTNKIIINVTIIYIFKCFFNLDITDTFAHFLQPTEQIIKMVFFAFFLRLFNEIISHIRFRCFSQVFILNFRCSKPVEIWSLLYSLVD